MKPNWKKLVGIAAVLALASLLVFNGVAFAQGPQPNAPKAQGDWPSWLGGMLGRGMMMMGRGGMMGRWGGPDDSLLSIAAEVLDKTQTELAQELRDGKTLAEIAGDKLDDIINQAVEARKADLDQAVADGKLSQAQADAMLALMKANLEQRAQQSFQAPGWGFGPGRGGWDCGPGMGPGFHGKGDWGFGRMGGRMGGWRGNR